MDPFQPKDKGQRTPGDALDNNLSYAQTIGRTLEWICRNHPEWTPAAVEVRRAELSRWVWQQHGQQVAHGPFKGLRLMDGLQWGEADKGVMCLGLYEREVVDDILALPTRITHFIEIGAAAGYYGIGLLLSGRFQRSTCFETEAQSRQILAHNARLNGVAARIRILGEAGPSFHEELDPRDLRDAVLLVDVEGREFDLLGEASFLALSDCVIYIELHDWFHPDGMQRLERLRRCCSATHTWREIRTGARDLGQFPELDVLCDSDRWLLCSEGRARAMKWARLDPIAHTAVP